MMRDGLGPSDGGPSSTPATVWPSVPRLVEGTGSGELDLRSIVEDALARCSDAATAPGPIERVLDDRARRRAVALDQGSVSLTSERLLGVPFVAKGNMAVRDHRGFGDTYLTVPASRDAEAIEVLESHGAVLVAVSRYTELALASSEAEIDGQAVPNPNDPRRSVGGSSSGSATAVRAGLVPLALGTDTGGSVRIPAAFAGVAGHKPTRGLLPRSGVMPVSWTLDEVGLFARTSADLSVTLTVLRAGADEPLPDAARIGMVTRVWEDHPRTESAAHTLMDSVRAKLDQKFDLSLIPLPEFATCRPILSDLVSYEAARSHGPVLQHRPEQFGRFVRARLEAGAELTEEDYRRSLAARDEVCAHLHEVFERVDLLVLPTIPFVPPLQRDVLRFGSSSHARLTRLANLGGLPAVSVPGAWVDARLPLGLQVVGPVGTDAAVLRLAQLLEQPFPPTERGLDDRAEQ